MNISIDGRSRRSSAKYCPRAPSTSVAYDVRVTYGDKSLLRLIIQVIDFTCFVGGRCRIRTCDFHRVKVALYR
jgi:hypothetical protein